MDDYYVHYLWGMDMVRFDKEVLRSDELSISFEEAMLRRIVQAGRDGVPFYVYDFELADYVRFLCTGEKPECAPPGQSRYEKRLVELRKVL